MPVPTDRRYSESHEWHKLEGGTLTLGLTQFAVDQLTDVTYVEMKPAGWRLLQEHWPVLDERYGKSGLIGRFIAAAAGGLPSEEHAANVEKFFRDHPAPYASEKIKQTLEGIRARARFRDRNRAGLSQFFER